MRSEECIDLSTLAEILEAFPQRILPWETPSLSTPSIFGCHPLKKAASDSGFGRMSLIITNKAVFSSEVVSLVNSATDFVKNIQPKKLLPSSGKLKREVSMEEIIQVISVKDQTFRLTSENTWKMSQMISVL